MRRLLVAGSFFAFLLLVWAALAAWGGWGDVLLPSPAAVGAYLVEAVSDGTLPRAIAVTGRRLAVGYAIGIVVGLPLGCLTSRFRAWSDTVRLVALGLQTLPSVCWVPFALLWFGQTESAMLFVVVMGTVWSILLATDAGLRQIPPIYLRAARVMGSKGVHTVHTVLIPAALPVVLGGMKQGWAFAWRSLMAAEIYVTILTGLGLGNVLHYGRELHATDQVLGVMLVIVVVGLAADRVLFVPAERWIGRRWGTGA